MTASKRAVSRMSLLPGWMRNEHPVYDLEVRRRVENRALGVMRLGCVPAIFASASLALTIILSVNLYSQGQWMTSWYSYEGLIATMLGWTLATLMLIQLGAGAMVNVLTIAQAAPTISGEIELQSWRLLRTTTLTLREIILAKYAAVLRQIRGPLLGILALRVASALTILMFTAYILLRQTFYYLDPSGWRQMFREFLWLPPLIAYLVWFVWYVSQPVIQLLLNGAIGLVASAYTTSRAQAIAAALVGRLGLWISAVLFCVAVATGLIFLHTAWLDAPYSSFEVYNELPPPTPLQETWVTSVMIGGYAAAMFAIQIALILILLGVTLRRARQLGV